MPDTKRPSVLQREGCSTMEAMKVGIAWLRPQELSNLARTCHAMAAAVTSLTQRRMEDAAQGLERWPVPISNQLDSCRYPFFHYTPFCRLPPSVDSLCFRQSWGAVAASSKLEILNLKKLFDSELASLSSAGNLQGVGCRCVHSCTSVEGASCAAASIGNSHRDGVKDFITTQGSDCQLQTPRSLDCLCGLTSHGDLAYDNSSKLRMRKSSSELLNGEIHEAGLPYLAKTSNFSELSNGMALKAWPTPLHPTNATRGTHGDDLTQTLPSSNELPMEAFETSKVMRRDQSMSRTNQQDTRKASPDSESMFIAKDLKSQVELKEGPPLLMECGAACTCSVDCGFRVTQHGLAVRVTVVRSSFKGWALHAAQLITQGSFVCEYAGELLTTAEARQRQKTYDFLEAGKPRCGPALLVLREYLPSGTACLRLNIDATSVGNVARFINHACNGGNLLPCLVRSAGSMIPKLAFFAGRDIMEGKELTYSYGGCGGVSSNSQPCFCGTSGCSGTLPSENT